MHSTVIGFKHCAIR